MAMKDFRLVLLGAVALSLSGHTVASAQPVNLPKIADCSDLGDALDECAERTPSSSCGAGCDRQRAKTVRKMDRDSSFAVNGFERQGQFGLIREAHDECLDTCFQRNCRRQNSALAKCAERRDRARAEARRMCRATEACKTSGRCSVDDAKRACVGPTSDEDCAAATPCNTEGRCTHERGTCVLASDDGCRRLPGCAEEGNCKYIGGGECGPGTTDECRRNPACRDQGLCVFQQGRCHPSNQAQCTKHPGCTKGGLCTYGTVEVPGEDGEPAVFLHACRANSTAECAKTTQCRDRGECVFRSDQCRPGSADDCKRHPACAASGLCDYKHGGCVPTAEHMPKGFVYLPPTRVTSTFRNCVRRGASTKCEPGSQTKRTELGGFFIQQTEFTQRDKRYASAKGSVTRASLSKAPDDRQPVVGATWSAAIEHANALSKKDGLEPCYSIPQGQARLYDAKGKRRSPEEKVTYELTRADCRGYRLPTKDEWARANKPAKRQTMDNLDRYEWLIPTVEHTMSRRPGGRGGTVTMHRLGTKKAGLKKPNHFGLFDMGGNAPEWLHDSGDMYSNSRETSVGDTLDHDRKTVDIRLRIRPYLKHMHEKGNEEVRAKLQGMNLGQDRAEMGFRLVRSAGSSPASDAQAGVFTAGPSRVAGLSAFEPLSSRVVKSVSSAPVAKAAPRPSKVVSIERMGESIDLGAARFEYHHGELDGYAWGGAWYDASTGDLVLAVETGQALRYFGLCGVDAGSWQQLKVASDRTPLYRLLKSQVRYRCK